MPNIDTRPQAVADLMATLPDYWCRDETTWCAPPMETRTCRACHEDKPEDKFDKVSNDTFGGYRRKICRSCWWASRTEEQQEAKRERQRRSVAKLRTETFDAYGGKCVCCGESEHAFLVMDHIEDNGASHRRTMRPNAPKSWAGNTAYRWLRQNGFPPGFQLLCANCNMAKARKEGCPHATNQRSEDV